MCGVDALVTDIHDAFRPSVQCAEGSRQVQLGEWRRERELRRQKLRQKADGASAESGDGLAAFFSTFY